MSSGKFTIPYGGSGRPDFAASPMDNLGRFIFYRSYSRWNPKEGRLERWAEAVKRAIEYNCGLASIDADEYAMLFDGVYNLRQFVAGRTLWAGGTALSRTSPLSNYNCAFVAMDDIDCIGELLYLLMLGCGVGVRILESDISCLPPVRTGFEALHIPYSPVSICSRLSNTSLEFKGKNTAVLHIGDSREGWASALDFTMRLISRNEYRHINRLVFNYDNIRPEGEPLKTFGGLSFGPKSLRRMLTKIFNITRRNCGVNDRKKLKPIDLLDIVTIIGECVSAVGIRRSAEMIIFEHTDTDCMESKRLIYSDYNNKRIIDENLSHRITGNNSVYYPCKPSKRQLREHLLYVAQNGEPGIINAESALRRKQNFKGLNPCAEVLLDSRGVCNLTTVNLSAFVKDSRLDSNALETAQRLSARAAVRMTCVELELHKWNNMLRQDPATGCSLTGWQDMVFATGMDYSKQTSLLQRLKLVARDEVAKYCMSLKIPVPKLVTAVKPEGTLSLMAGASQGVHLPVSKHYIRRIRTAKGDPLSRLYSSKGYNITPDESGGYDVVEFPVMSRCSRTLQNTSAIEQLETYKMFVSNYTDHNCSVTIGVKHGEWNGVLNWIWNNWDDIVAISLMPLQSKYYPLMPCEPVEESMYKKLSSMICCVSDHEIEGLDWKQDPSPAHCCT